MGRVLRGGSGTSASSLIVSHAYTLPLAMRVGTGLLLGSMLVRSQDSVTKLVGGWATGC